jgi:hypothetical protein
VVEQVKWMLIKLCCLNKRVPKLEKPDTYSLLIVDCGIYPLCLHTTARNVAVQAYTVNKIFHRNVYNIKNVITLGDT